MIIYFFVVKFKIMRTVYTMPPVKAIIKIKFTYSMRCLAMSKYFKATH